jgi:predicted transcriptional regulator
MKMNPSGNDIPRIVAAASAAYFTGNRVDSDSAPRVVRTIAETIASLTEARTAEPANVTVPAREHVLCAACGRPFRTLKRHLGETHGMTPEQYRSAFALPPKTPMVAPGYVARQAESARQRHASKRVSALPRGHAILPRNPATGVLRAASHR